MMDDEDHNFAESQPRVWMCWTQYWMCWTLFEATGHIVIRNCLSSLRDPAGANVDLTETWIELIELSALRPVTVPGGGGHSGHASKGQSPGANILPPPHTQKKNEAGALDPHGPLAEVDFLSGFRAPRDGSEPRGKHQGSAERTRAPRDKSGPMERIRAPRGGSGPSTSDRDSERRIRTCRTNQGPAERIRVLQDGWGPRRTKYGPAGRSMAPAWWIRAPRNK